MNGIPIQYLNGVGVAEQAYNKQTEVADKTRRRKFQKWQLETPAAIRRRQAAVQYYTRGLDNKTVNNIGYVSKGLDFVGYLGDGSIEDSEMVYNHLLRTKQIVDSAPQAVALYQNPQQLSQMLGYVIDNWDSANREKAIDNMAREESRLIDEGKIVLGEDSSDAHFLDAGENYDPETQRVLSNGAVETLPNKRGLFNRLKKTTAFVNVAQKDADFLGDSTLTRKLRATIRQNVAANRKHVDKKIKETTIKNGHVHSKTIKLPVYAAQSTSLHGLNGVDDDLQELLYGVDFAFNADEGLSQADNIENYRRYFARLSAAIAVNPLAFYDTEAEANAVRAMLAQLIPIIGDEAAMDALAAKYEGINGFEGLGELNGKLKKALKKATKAVTSAAKNVAKATANATKQVAKTTANVTKAAAKTTANVAKTAAKATKNVTKAAANATKAVAKAAVNTTKAAVKSTVNATKATANVVKAAAQAATGNKAKAKETLKKAGQQAKAAVTQPAKAIVSSTKDVVKNAVVEPAKTAIKTTVQTTKDVVKKAVVEPTKTVVKETKAVVKNAVVEPTKTLVKETIVNPTKAAFKLTKKITKAAFKLTKKVIKAVWFYNPLTLLIKGGLLAAFKLNMFRMASRSYLGSLSEEEAINKYGITPDEWEAQKKSFDFIRKMFCNVFGGKESKLLAALKKGASKKWKGTDNPTSEAEIKAAGEAVEADSEIVAELEADMAEDKAELESQGVKASENASAAVGKQEFKVSEDNRRTTKEQTAMYEASGESSKKVADLPKGTALYISTDPTDTDGTWIAACTTDNKYGGYIKISALAEIYDPESQPVMAVSGLCDNGYSQVGGLGEPVTIGATIAAAGGSILTICSKMTGFFKNVVGVSKDIVDTANAVNDLKESLSPEEQPQAQAAEYDIEMTPGQQSVIYESLSPEQQAEYAALSPEQQQAYIQQVYKQQQQGGGLQTMAAQSIKTAKTKQQAESSTGVNKKLIIGVAAGLVGLGLIAVIANNNNN